VEAALRERFGFEPRRFDPDQAVAKGAALFALIESIKIVLPETSDLPETLDQVAAETGLPRHRLLDLATKTVTNVVPRAFGVKVLEIPDDTTDAENEPLDGNDEDQDDETGPIFSIAHILETNRPLPATPETQRFYTAHRNQTMIRIEIWEQAGATMSPSTADNARIGDGVITGLPALPKGSPIDVNFAMDEKGLLSVEAIELTTGKELKIELQIQGLSPEQLERSRNTVAGYAVSG
jgi:molecular chaperone DnaK (HSP70)